MHAIVGIGEAVDEQRHGTRRGERAEGRDRRFAERRVRMQKGARERGHGPVRGHGGEGTGRGQTFGRVPGVEQAGDISERRRDGRSHGFGLGSARLVAAGCRRLVRGLLPPVARRCGGHAGQKRGRLLADGRIRVGAGTLEGRAGGRAESKKGLARPVPDAVVVVTEGTDEPWNRDRAERG